MVRVPDARDDAQTRVGQPEVLVVSSTHRGAVRAEHDYYITPIPEIVKFLKAWREDVHPTSWPEKILDPCAGGNKAPITFANFSVLPPTPPPYPEAFKRINDWSPTVFTLDIREDSQAQYIGNFLDGNNLIGFGGFDAIIFNPPFSLAMDFIQHAINTVRPSGFVVSLCRLNFLGSDRRNAWLRYHPPTWIYVHGKRMSFTPDGKTDSIEYAHFVWEKEPRSKFSKLRVLEY